MVKKEMCFDDKLEFYDICQKTKDLTYLNHKKEMEFIIEQNDTWENFIDILESRYSVLDVIYLQNLESMFNIEASILLATHGYYKQAISLLRLWFENSLYALYYQDHEVEFEWLSLDIKPPKGLRISFSGDLLNYLFMYDTFDNYNKNFKCLRQKDKDLDIKNFREWIEFIYNELSAHIHGRGLHRSNMFNLTFKKGETRSYNKEIFIFWHDLFNNIFQILIIAHLLYNPKLFNRHKSKRKEILDCLKDEMVDTLRKTISIKY